MASFDNRKQKNSASSSHRYKVLENWDKKPMVIQAELSLKQLNAAES